MIKCLQGGGWSRFLVKISLGEADCSISQIIRRLSPHFKGILQAAQKTEFAKVSLLEEIQSL